MTQAQCVTLLRELLAVERLLAAVESMTMQPEAAPEWRYGLVALDDRRRWLRYCLSLEHHLLVDSAREILAAQQTTGLRPEPTPPTMPDLPGPRVVH